MIAGRKEVSKFIDWAADIKFADFSVWSHARICACLGRRRPGGNDGNLHSRVGLALTPINEMQTEQECEP